MRVLRLLPAISEQSIFRNGIKSRSTFLLAWLRVWKGVSNQGSACGAIVIALHLLLGEWANIAYLNLKMAFVLFKQKSLIEFPRYASIYILAIVLSFIGIYPLNT